VKEGDIILAPFRFSETEERKLRPCLVLKVAAVWLEIAFISSQKVAKAFATEVVIGEDEAKLVGLKKTSRIDFAKRDKIPICEVKRQVGNIRSLPKRRLRECYEAAKAAGILDD